MKLLNKTPYPADISTGSTGDTEMLCAIACKVTYVSREGELVPVPRDQAWPVFDRPFDYEGVALNQEMEFRKSGIDILVIGKAVSPGRKPVQHLRVMVECGNIKHEAVVIGNRRWKKSFFKLVASDPEPFSEMPLTNDRAFGGAAKYDGFDMPHAVNPDGRGFYMTKKEAEGQPLPNLEPLDHRIESWNDHPMPTCFLKPKGILDQEALGEPDPAKRAMRLTESAFHQTVPALVARPEDLGEQLRLSGFSADGDMVFPVPDLTGPSAHAHVGPLRSRFASKLSTLILLTEPQVLIATYLCVFRYLFRTKETRSVELRWSRRT